MPARAEGNQRRHSRHRHESPCSASATKKRASDDFASDASDRGGERAGFCDDRHGREAENDYWPPRAVAYASFDNINAPPAVLRPFAWIQPLPRPRRRQARRQLHDRSLQTYDFTITGLPNVAVPCGFTTCGFPVGIQIVAGGNEGTCMEAASAYSAVRPLMMLRPATEPAHSGPSRLSSRRQAWSWCRLIHLRGLRCRHSPLWLRLGIEPRYIRPASRDTPARAHAQTLKAELAAGGSEHWRAARPASIGSAAQNRTSEHQSAM